MQIKIKDKMNELQGNIEPQVPVSDLKTLLEICDEIRSSLKRMLMHLMNFIKINMMVILSGYIRQLKQTHQNH